MARAVRAALAEHDGDILAFLPGMAEIRRTQVALADCGALVLPLHGDLPPAEQDRALRPAERRRVVLATSIAETSLTVPGVRIVVDGGWRRAPRLDAVHRPDPADDAADQPCGGGTAGRPRRARGAGRRHPAVDRRRCIAAWPPIDRPEILEAELSGAGARLRRLGRAARRPAVPRPAAAGALAAADRAADRAWRTRRVRAHHRAGSRMALWARIRGWRR